MIKRLLLAIVALFVAWSILDILIHGLILASTYQATASLWRPMNEMKMGLMKTLTLVVAIAFAGIYAALIDRKSVSAGAKFGLLFGIATGFSMGFGTYCVMPIPMRLAAGWAAGTLVETVIGGLIVGAIIRRPGTESAFQPHNQQMVAG